MDVPGPRKLSEGAPSRHLRTCVVALGVVAGVLGTHPAAAAPQRKKPAPATDTPATDPPATDKPATRPAAVKPPKPAAKSKPRPSPAAQKEAALHLTAGVALYKVAKYAAALDELQRAYELAPNVAMLYYIADCHRELAHYPEAVATYRQFLAEGKGKVPPTRLAGAKIELEGILARVARVTVVVKPAEGAVLSLDGAPLDKPVGALILLPGEHRLTARLDGRRDAERNLELSPGDQVTVELALTEPLPSLPAPPPIPPPPTATPTPPPSPAPTVTTAPTQPPPAAPTQPPAPSLAHASSARQRWFSLSAGYGTNLRRASDSGVRGAPSVRIAAAYGSRLEFGLDGVFVNYAVVPSVGVRLAGDKLSVHLIGAAPIAFVTEPMATTFVAAAVGLGVRLRATESLSFRLESYASFAGEAHGTTVPTFLRGELWF